MNNIYVRQKADASHEDASKFEYRPVDKVWARGDEDGAPILVFESGVIMITVQPFYTFDDAETFLKKTLAVAMSCPLVIPAGGTTTACYTVEDFEELVFGDVQKTLVETIDMFSDSHDF